MVKIVVAGNATIDAIIPGNTEKIGDDTIAIMSDGIKEYFRVEDPPIRSGYKHHVNPKLSRIVESLWYRMQPGGGGYNSITAMRRLTDIGKELDLHYMDVSIPYYLIAKGLEMSDINPHFFFEREVPVNAIISIGGDRVIVKGYQLSMVKPDENKNQRARKIIDGSDSLLLNSVKDKGYMECYLAIAQEKNVPLYALVTTSLEGDFIFERVLPVARGILNYDEIPFLWGIDTELDQKSKMDLAFETLRQIRLKINPSMPIYATLGRNGAYCASKNSIRHVFLKPEYAEKVDENISLQPRRAIGAGDNFAGALVAYDTFGNRKYNLNDIIIRASTVAIRHIGYSGNLPRDAFKVVEYPIKPLAPN